MRYKLNKPPDICPLCGGDISSGEMTFTADLESGLLVVRDVPAQICGQCGAEWVEHAAALRIDEYAKDMQAKGSLVEILSYRTAISKEVEA